MHYLTKSIKTKNMKTTAHIITFPDGTTEQFKSQKAAFAFVVDKGLLPRKKYYNAHRKAELARLTTEGILTYQESFVEIAAEQRTNDELKKYIKAEVKKMVDEIPPKVIELVVDGKKKKTIDGIHHYAFGKVLKCVSAKCNVMLVGPAGSGKTTCVSSVADALGLKFYAISVGLQTSKVEFMGYMDATGTYVRTLFREAYEKGGVFLIDEIDAGNPGIMTIVNAALANGVCAFPDKMINKHPNFICCAAANTYGKGADRMYVGRNQLDAATLDRFVKLDFDYDEVMESKLATNESWFQLIRDIRKAVMDKKLRVLVTPRATFNGCALLEQGLNFWEILELVLFNGCSEEEKTIIMNATSLRKDLLEQKSNAEPRPKRGKTSKANDVDAIVEPQAIS